MGTSAHAQAGRDRVRDPRLQAEQMAREQLIDEAVVEVELAWEARAAALRAVVGAECAAAAAV